MVHAKGPEAASREDAAQVPGHVSSLTFLLIYKLSFNLDEAPEFLVHVRPIAVNALAFVNIVGAEVWTSE